MKRFVDMVVLPCGLACHGGHLETVQTLVKHGADVDMQDNRKMSPLMVAFRKGHVKEKRLRDPKNRPNCANRKRKKEKKAKKQDFTEKERICTGSYRDTDSSTAVFTNQPSQRRE
ncbi:hypothetical protein KIN20_007390 [Parelaphostrongylus tenuis]|uniref:Uncharacterized protein n=1 Tax=Parelaphostrongylus tenuis TaxID=148309 RepID=A0AAD5M5G1_PARTN|nr:hypothetical protein KIN20_007390 [Parelaphostrongylus tenuis]